MFGTIVRNIQDLSFTGREKTDRMLSPSGLSLSTSSSRLLDGMRVLVCEDDKGNNELLVKTLRRLGCSEAQTFDTTRSLITHITDNIEEYGSDKDLVILMDIKMPGQLEQGDDACVSLRKMGIKCRIIAVTGLQTRSHNVQHYMGCGFSDVLFKPYSRQQLVTSLTNGSD